MDDRELGPADPPEAEFWVPAPPPTGPNGRLEHALSVVVCTYARPASLARCVDSLKRQTRRADTLLVVDASRDDLSERALASDPGLASAAARVGYVRVGERHRGLTRQRNVALGRVPDELVAFFDDDIVLAPRCLEEMEAVHRSTAGTRSESSRR
jgi:glycosyltransferase involved in cell wall biosynthesis